MDSGMRARVGLVALVLVAAAGPGWANSAILTETCEVISTIVLWLVGVGYVVGTIGLALLAIKTAGSGRFASGSFLSLMGGLFLLGSVPSFMAFLLNDTFSYTC